MEFAAGRSRNDPALDTLLLPLADGTVRLPAGKRVLFLRARAGPAMPDGAQEWACEQGFRPAADRLQSAGMRAVAEVSAGEAFELVLVLAPRQRQEARALLSRALQHAGCEGTVLVAAANDEGARSVQADFERLAGPVRSLSKHHCRAFWSAPAARAINAELLAEWAALDAPRAIADGRFLSRPGLFAWDRIDPASAMLATCLPPDLQGRAADLGAGFGFLSAELIARCPGIVAVDVFEAEARALALARVNLGALPRRGTPIPLGFHWHDVAAGLPGRYDVIVSNPPFHEGRAGQPELGRAFIAAAALALRPGGRLWLVANRHLPYEETLAGNFSRVRVVRDEQGFKVIEAIRAQS